jgi:hypothetical protein
MRNITSLLLALFVLASCSDEAPRGRSKIMGFAPVYGTKAELMALFKMEAPRNLSSPGKIYSYGDLLFVNDANEGVLVINNDDPENPVKIGFLSIPGNNDIAIRNGYLYADYGLGIVTIDISDVMNPQSKSFVEREQSDISLVPPDWMVQKFATSNNSDKVYFECVDPSKGTIIKWEHRELKSPDCFKYAGFWF